ncbi:cytochrome P450 protein [Rutstroemia sp. NJR-2017a BBW]|nr:cytochrome P450 protein [Rutstroemia sp. NJR-2017a BBW]
MNGWLMTWYVYLSFHSPSQSISQPLTHPPPESPNFDPSSRNAALAGISSIHIMKHIPWVNNFMKKLPDPLIEKLIPSLTSFLKLKRSSRRQVQEIMAGENEEWKGRDHMTIFHAILDSKLPPEEKTVERLSEDAQVLVMAGTLTTASALEMVTYWLLEQPETLRKLKEELKTVMPRVEDVGKVPLAVLEALPYLTGVIKEGLRLSHGLSARSQRVDPDNPIVFTDKETGTEYTIPPKTPVSITPVQIHLTEEIFPHSNDFIPERWLGDSGKKRDKYLVSFMKGSRACLGINLAYGELYMVVAHMWRVWGSREVRGGDEFGWLELWGTERADVEVERDLFIPSARRGGEGVRVLVHGV